MNDIEEIDELIPGISSELKAQFEHFFELIQQYNKTINLVSKNTIPRAVTKHFFDSFQGLSIVQPEIKPGQPIFDYGSGNGFPGLVAAMMFQNESVILVERDARKSEFLKIAAGELKLKNVEVHNGGVEDLKEGSCQTVISRAMSPLPKFLLQSRKAINDAGTAFLFKGDHWSSEFTQIPAQVFDYWEVDVFGSYELPKSDGSRFIIRCQRI